jgi:outer membrane cobalamin receptor
VQPTRAQPWRRFIAFAVASVIAKAARAQDADADAGTESTPEAAATLPLPAASGPEPEPGSPDPDQLGAVIVTGTRRSDRTLVESNVPVDVVSAAELANAPAGDLNVKLAQSVPSFNMQRMPLADGAIFNRPATLRGLSPDQTLVLINGKRRHRSAYIDVTAQGAQAVDLAELPLAAIERVEVLRDGASAFTAPRQRSDEVVQPRGCGAGRALHRRGLDAQRQAGDAHRSVARHQPARRRQHGL